MKYKVNFSGFAYVEADSPDKAGDKVLDDDTVYSDTRIDDVEEVDSFDVEI